MITRRDLIARGAAAMLLPALGEAAIPRNRIRALRDAVRGRVLTPGDSGYNAARVVFNTRWDGVRPPAVVQVRDTADVRAVVRWADRYDVPLVARSGGHGYSGNSTSRSAVVVDLDRLDQIRFSDGIATLGPGARLGDVYARLAARGVTIPAGSCPTVAVGGLVLGGGMGLAGRAMGLTCDRVRSFDIVDAEGRRRRVDDGALFWALRGGGGSFAIVTAVRLRTRRVSNAAFFSISYPRGAREEALARWDAFAPRAPSDLTAILTLTGEGATAFGQYLGSAPQLRRLIAPLGGSPSVGSADYLTVQRRWAGRDDPPRSAFAASSTYVTKRLGGNGRRAFLDAADTGATLILDAYGGAINRPDRDDTAFPHRAARFRVQVLSYAAIPTARDRVKRARRSVAPYGTGAYANYADPDLTNATRNYYGANLERLRRVKREVDPGNRFRPAQGIRPT
ncbi:FAD-binding oxidoreductase [Solirubrobacter sp. CPCC 204708]|uniref:FAD-binding oxidoreductase n=1 Tax=Solirubrobacter deserti TaxID=2282478 RepID=A0ABT4RD46_9ACTN|nr:FAD-binding oxidoreductase [Solirubrobacter deserti]MBE2317774.1 FAD-binding oxidoreductase [Solirubrobacter deserti]MDA0136449.1 FAD-binding oxidoreductase [Solirubrobacter deserti]